MSVSIDYTGGVFKANRAKSVGTVTAGTGPYNLANASYDSVSFSVSGQETAPQGLFFKPDGTKMYVVGFVGQDINEYTLSTAWDIATASYVQSLNLSAQVTQPVDMFLKSDGTKMYVIDFAVDDVNEYTLSTAWDISTASYVQNFSVTAQEDQPLALFFKTDGTKMYVAGGTGDDVNEYNLSAAWDVSTASYGQNFSMAAQVGSPQGMFFTPDGTGFFVIDGTGDDVNEYALSTAWDVSTSSYVQSFSIVNQEANPSGLFFKPDGTKLYIVGTANDTIYQYSTGTATTLDLSTGNYFSHTPSVNTLFAFNNPPASGTAAGFALALTGGNAAEVYDIANASYDSVSFSVATQVATPTGMFFKPDGTKMYICDYATDYIYQYSLSTAWDISTASYDSVSFDFTVTEQLLSVFFKPDGTKLWMIEYDDQDIVRQYSMSTAWDISTLSEDTGTTYTATGTTSAGIWFKPDGTKMYISSFFSPYDIKEYSLSTAWDITSASATGSTLSLSAEGGTVYEIFMSPDGYKLFTIRNDGDTVHQYNLSSAFDLSTASYSSISFSVASQEGNAHSLFFKSDGSKMYIAGGINDTVYQYTTQATSAATFTYPSSVKFPSGTAPAGPAIGETDVLVFYTDDGGTTYQGFKAGDAMA